MDSEIYKKLIQMAFDAQKHSYSPYSNFAVGSALLTSDGSIYTGCNIESVSFSPTICAERTAIFKAVSEGIRSFKAIAIVGNKIENKNKNIKESSDYCVPCGVCRQVMSEFCDVDFEIIAVKNENDYLIYKISELLPANFKEKNIL